MRRWFTLSNADASTRCNKEKLNLADTDRGYLSLLVPDEQDSTGILDELICGNIGKDRPLLLQLVFERVKALWPGLDLDSRTSLSHSLLEVALSETTGSEQMSSGRTFALETLRMVTLESNVLLSLLQSVLQLGM